MKTLSIRQPYASLICLGFKNVENRSRSASHRGPFFVHATKNYADIGENFPEQLPLCFEFGKLLKKFKEKDLESENLLIKKGELLLKNQIYEREFRLIKSEMAAQREGKTLFPENSIIGQVELVDVIENSNSFWAEKDFKHLILSNPVLFENPVKNVKGKQNWWDFDFPVDKRALCLYY